MNYPAWFPSISLCVRCHTSHVMVVEKQCGYEIFIKPALMINYIAVFAQMYVTYNYCTVAYTIAMAVVLCVAKTWVQRTNVKFAVINNIMFVIISF